MQTTSIICVYTPEHRTDCLAAFASNIPQFFAPNELQDFDNFLTRIEGGNDTASFYVVVVEGTAVGCGGFGDRENTGVFSLAWGFMHRDYHKLGLGERLLSYRLEQIRLLKPEATVELDTTQFSAGFFEKYGFKTTKITDDYYAAGMHRYDMVLSV